MALGQNSAFGLLGFLQSLQQGQDQQNQRREQFLQEKMQRFDQDRQFKIQSDQAKVAADAAERDKTLFDRNTEDYNAQAPVRALTTATALNVPQEKASTLVGDFKKQRVDIDGKIAEAMAKLQSTRDPNMRSFFKTLITNLQRSKDDLQSGLSSQLGAIAGLKDINPFVQQFGGVDPTKNDTGKYNIDGIVENQLPPLTKEDREALRTAGQQYNLGALATPYFALPKLTTRQQTATDVFGNPVTYKVGDIVNPTGGIDYNKFVTENMIPIQSMLQAQINAGKSAFATPQEVLKDQLGADERLWPVKVDDKGNVTPKEGTDGKSWIQGLSPVDRQRVIASLRPFINVDESTQRGIDMRHAAALKSIEAQRADFEARRDLIFKNAETKYEVQNKSASQSNLPTEFLIARDAYRETLHEAADGQAADETMAKALAKAPAPDEMANLFGGDPNAINVPPAILSSFYSVRAKYTANALAKAKSGTAGTAAAVAAKTFAIGQSRNIASAQAKETIKKMVEKMDDYKGNNNQQQYKSIMTWVNSQ